MEFRGSQEANSSQRKASKEGFKDPKRIIEGIKKWPPELKTTELYLPVG